MRRFVGAGMLLMLLAVTLAACAPAPAPGRSGWQMLFMREGWQGGPTLDLRAVGDVMLARGVAKLIEREGRAAPFAASRELLGGDLVIGNLESPLADQSAAIRPGPYRLIAAPELAPALHEAGFNLLGLANNHGLDAGPAGLTSSLEGLRRSGIAPAGVGMSEAEALAPVLLQVDNLRIAVFAFNDVLDPADGDGALARAGDSGWPNPDFAVCAAGSCPPGRAWLSERALAAVAAGRDVSDVVVVLVHWGVEYAAEPSARQRAWAGRLVAAGADLVLGAHPHVLQPAEAIAAGGRHGFVAYSLGNFVFDGPADPAVSSGAVLRALLDRDGVAFVAVAPLATAGGRPQPRDPGSVAGRAALAALGSPLEASGASPVSQAASTTPDANQDDPIPAPEPQSYANSDTFTAWIWDGQAGRSVAPPAGLRLDVPPMRLAADLRGDGEPLWAELDAEGVVTLRDGPEPDAPIVWRNEDPSWRFTHMAVGDPNDDGRVELLLILWQRDERGRLSTQPYLLGWRGGSYRIIWGGSATERPIQGLALADLDGDGRGELIVLEGGLEPGDPGDYVSVWRWHGWGFQLEWRSTAGRWRAIGLHDLDGDGRLELVAR